MFHANMSRPCSMTLFCAFAVFIQFRLSLGLRRFLPRGYAAVRRLSVRPKRSVTVISWVGILLK